MTSYASRDFIRRQGPAFLAHLLRRVSDALVEGSAEWHPEQELTHSPRTSSTLLALDEKGSLSVTELATLLRQSHPLVIHWIKHLRELGLVTSARDPHDGRRSLISLTAQGRATVARLRQALELVDRAMLELVAEAMPGLPEGLWKMEGLLRDRPFADRLRALEGQGRAPAGDGTPLSEG